MGLLKDEMPKEMEIIRSFLQEKDEYRNRFSFKKANSGFSKMGCAFLMFADPMLPYAEFGRNDHRDYALHFIVFLS